MTLILGRLHSPKLFLVIYFAPVAIVRINNSLYHPFVSLTRGTEGTEYTWLFFWIFLCPLCLCGERFSLNDPHLNEVDKKKMFNAEASKSAEEKRAHNSNKETKRICLYTKTFKSWNQITTAKTQRKAKKDAKGDYSLFLKWFSLRAFSTTSRLRLKRLLLVR